MEDLTWLAWGEGENNLSTEKPSEACVRWKWEYHACLEVQARKQWQVSLQARKTRIQTVCTHESDSMRARKDRRVCVSVDMQGRRHARPGRVVCMRDSAGKLACTERRDILCAEMSKLVCVRE